VLGASAGFIVQMALAVAAGSLLTLLPVHVKDFVVAMLFLGGAAYLLFSSEKEAEQVGTREAQAEKGATRRREIATAFVVIFIGEFGDLTQIQAANFSAKTHQPIEVFLASSLALVCVSFVGAYGGQLLQRVVPLEKIRIAGGVIFAALGIYTLVKVFTS
jgi:putative Ca2+/H+ antiporter (TMEM165/GDT1 family)